MEKLSENWYRIYDGNVRAFDFFKRHYSFNKVSSRSVCNKTRFCPPGKRIVLVNEDFTALFVWSWQKFRKDGQTGYNCAIFRNESSVLSSNLIKEATYIAFDIWGVNRCFTYVDAKRIKSSNAGYCYKVCGWKPQGYSKARKFLLLSFDVFTTYGLE